MSFLTDLLEKIGLNKPTVDPNPINFPLPKDGDREAAPGRTKPKAISKDDVARQLDRLSGGNESWKTSVVDLLNLLKMDSSLEGRKRTAVELGCPPRLMTDTAKMDKWLHRKLLKRIARKGGNIPQKLKDN